jgi:hypothetical protein
MSKKLTVREQEFLVSLITKKIAEKRSKQIKDLVSTNPKFIELQERVDKYVSLCEDLDREVNELNKEFCKELGLSGGYDETCINLSSNYKPDLRICGVSAYMVGSKVQERLMYEQIVLGGVSEDLVSRLVEELS